ncbi:MAG: PQQ-dependent sugar dehydrogenase [Aeromicrobium sp.]
MNSLRRRLLATATAASALLVFGLLQTPGQAADLVPSLNVVVVKAGLQIPWDLAFLPDGSMLYTERDRERITLRKTDGSTSVVLENQSTMWHSGETGLMSIELARDFAITHDFFTCHGFKDATKQDVRVVRWHLGTNNKASWVRTIVAGLPSTSGRHAGCSLQKGAGQILFIGTGDAATGTNPQNLKSAGGKVLRVDGRTGAGWDQSGDRNPFITSTNTMTRRIWSYGHRNVQGLALRSDGIMWSVEQGSDRDDEVNLLRAGGNAGWNPVRKQARDPAYNESVPMTDFNLPGAQYGARWRSGFPTLATSGGTFVYGSQWGALNGALAVSILKNQTLMFLRFQPNGTYIAGSRTDTLNTTYGRLRGTVQGPDGALYITTSNGTDDKILKVVPAP